MNIFDKLPLRRNLAAKKEVEKVLAKGMKPYQVMPALDNLNADFIALKSNHLNLKISKQTPIASMGSCFAREIKKELVRREFNYVQTEHNAFAANGSCSWGRVYSPANIVEILKYTLNGKVENHRFSTANSGKTVDQIRYRIAYYSLPEAIEDTQKHISCSLEALKQAKVLILTIGQNEVWYNQKYQFHLAQSPLKNQKDECVLKRFSVSENVQLLSEAYQLLKKINPDISLILTVSPVPSTATFFDTNVCPQSFSNKAILRAAVEELRKIHPEITYFPSFEIVLNSRTYAFGPDNRHVLPRTVKKIMSAFCKEFTI